MDRDEVLRLLMDLRISPECRDNLTVAYCVSHLLANDVDPSEILKIVIKGLCRDNRNLLNEITRLLQEEPCRGPEPSWRDRPPLL